jgi:hypothetical protein
MRVHLGCICFLRYELDGVYANRREAIAASASTVQLSARIVQGGKHKLVIVEVAKVTGLRIIDYLALVTLYVVVSVVPYTAGHLLEV